MKHIIWVLNVAWKSQAFFLSIIFVLYGILYLFDPLVSFLIKQLINNLQFHTMLSPKILLCIITIYFLTSLQNIQYSYSMIFIEKIENELSIVLQKKFFKALEKVNLIHYDQKEYLDKLHRSEELSWYGMSNLLNEIFHMIAQIISLGVTAYLIIQESILFIILLLFVSLIKHVFDGYYTKEIIFNQKYIDAKERKIEYLFELLTEKRSIKELKIGRKFEWIYKKWEDENKKKIDNKIKFIKKWNVLYFISGIIGSGADKLMLYLLAYLVIKNEISLGSFFFIYNIKEVFLQGIDSIFQSWITIKEQEIYVKEFRELLKVEDSYEYKKTLGNDIVVCKDLGFSYHNKQQALKNISFTIKRGEIIAIVGENGSGKSTLAKIILGVLKPSKGKLQRTDKKINSVYQDFAKFELSFEENIVFGDLENREQEKLFFKAIEKGGIEKIYDKVQRNKMTILGKSFDEKGVELSGGEWQKLAVSRGFFGENPFIIFDEPSASLDPISEVKQYGKIKESLTEEGGIIITHRIGLAKNADRILFLKNGELVEEGTHEELIKKQGIYKEFFDIQAKWYQQQGGRCNNES